MTFCFMAYNSVFLWGKDLKVTKNEAINYEKC